MDGVTPSTPADRQAIFKQHILRRVQMVLRRLPPPSQLLPEQPATETLHVLPYAFTLPEAWPHTRRLLRTAAPGMVQAAYWDEWTQQLVRGVGHCRQHNDADLEAELQLHLGILGQRRSQFAEARRHLEAAAAAYNRLNQSRGMARALNQLAYLDRLQRRFADAEQRLETVCGLLTETDEEWAFSDYVRGLIALDKRQWPESVEYSRRAADLAARTNQPRLMGRCLLCCGVALEKNGDLAEAAEVCRRAIAAFEELGDRYYQAIARMNLGNVYFALDQWQVALNYYLQAKRIFQETQDWVYLGHVNHNIGMCYRQKQVWQQAKEAYLTSMTYWQRLSQVERWINTMDELGLTYLDEGDVEQAKATFSQALDRLSEIEGQPGYEHWLAEVTAHLAQASEV